MRDRYFPPTYRETQFHCAMCGVFASQYWRNLLISTNPTPDSVISACKCSHCGRWAYWEDQSRRMIIPAEAAVEPAHGELPEDCLSEYLEARSVFAHSPRASAALLRLCIQKLMPHLGERGVNLNDDIGALVSKGLSPTIQQSLDYCRVIGNNAVHPGEIDLNDTPETAQQLFGMINFIVEDRIARPKEIAALYLKLPEKAREAIEKRDGNMQRPAS
jgi:hypothetical protein